MHDLFTSMDRHNPSLRAVEAILGKKTTHVRKNERSIRHVLCKYDLYTQQNLR